MATEDTRPSVTPLQRNIALRPDAAPVFDYERPQEPVQDNRLLEFAKDLSGLDRNLGAYLEQRQADETQTDLLRGQAEFYKQNQVGYAEATRRGLIPAQASPAFVAGYKRAQGSVAGYGLEARVNQAYDQWDGKEADDPAAFDEFLGKYLKDNIHTDDPEILRGLLPRVNSLREQLLARHVQDVHNATVRGSMDAHSALADNAIDDADAQGLQRPEGTDYEGLWARLSQIREDGFKSGMRSDQIDKAMMDTVAAKAVELRDPHLLDFFSTSVPGTDHAWKDTPYGQKVFEQTQGVMERMARQAVADETKRHQEADKKALGVATQGAIEWMTTHQDEPIPAQIMVAGRRVDPKFDVQVMNWQATIRSNQSAENQGALTETTWDILNGGGMAAVTRGLYHGIFTNPQDLRAAYDLVQKVQGNASGAGGGILKIGAVKDGLAAIKYRTLDAGDLTNPNPNLGFSDAGLEAATDFRLQVLDWAQRNPDASLQDQEKAVFDIREGILKRIVRDEGGIGEATYDRSGLPAVGPTGVPAAQPQAKPRPANQRGATGDFSAPAPAQPPQAQPQQAPAPSITPEQQAQIDDWFHSLPSDQQRTLTATARKQGVPLDDFLAKAHGVVQQQERAKAQPTASPAQSTAPVHEVAQAEEPQAGPEPTEQQAEPQRVNPPEDRLMADLRAHLGDQVLPVLRDMETAGGPAAVIGKAVGDWWRGRFDASGEHRAVAAESQPTPQAMAPQTSSSSEASTPAPAEGAHEDRLMADLRGKLGDRVLPVLRDMERGGGPAGRIGKAVAEWWTGRFGTPEERRGQDQAAGVSAPAPEQRQSIENPAREAIRPVIDTAARALGKVGEAARGAASVAETIYQNATNPPPENTPAAPEIERRVSQAIEAAMRDTSRKPTGHYALARINTDPRIARILDFVAGPESNGNYNAVFGNAGSKQDLSKLTLDGVIGLPYVTVDGKRYSARGRYQFLKGTLQGLKSSMGLKGTERFTPELQDRMAITLLERRGLKEWLAGKMTDTEFANNLAKEWASLPNLITGRSHYDGDGVNTALVSPDEVRGALGGGEDVG